MVMMKLEDWLDDLCVRFIINLPKSELESVERICFQVEEAQWFYEDFIRPLDPSLPSLNLRAFSLKIFQHCPLFSQWSHEHHMSAFAEFLAYKQRVPVRGAIMLNEDMDQVVLVKGWKKGANWSFPRGKINKDEDDLDCAVREVYEETGFDIREVGLVKEEKEMKYIEVTMREQHMRLYVFRGVPRDTYFEPRTRKEISKIEWYKLTDLPTLKKHKHQDSNGQPQPVNANKFYMVAPFLNPLKKWISQQRKNENRHSLPYLAPPPFSEDVSQDESELSRPHLQQVSSYGASNLPEVANTTPQERDPSADLKRLLKINVSGSAQIPPSQTGAAPSNNVAKSSALLALLRSGSTAETRDAPQITPQQQDLPSVASQQAHMPLFQTFDVRWPPEVPNVNIERYAPYQNVGDPQFSRSKAESLGMSAIPPASALPKLTNHTKSLLDAFRVTPSATVPAAPPRALPAAFTPPAKIPLAQTQTLLDINTTPQQPPLSGDFVPTYTAAAQPVVGTVPTEARTVTPGTDQRQNLMNLFRQPPSNFPPRSKSGELTSSESHPAELAADVVATSTPQHLEKSKRDKTKPITKRHDKHAAPREGETAATINGPLNQPQFDGIARSIRKGTNEARRSPVPANKTLYDHKNPAPIKILARPEDTRSSPARSPLLPQVHQTSPAPRDGKTPRERKEPPKPFQPQILRRPQTPATTAAPSKENIIEATTSPAFEQAKLPVIQQKPSQTDSHRQALLSLFSNPLQTHQNSSGNMEPVSAVSAISTMPASQPISPLTDAQIHGIEPISTRSRVGSLTSVGGRPAIEKRQTNAGDKAFLLGYLGRIASREGE